MVWPITHVMKRRKKEGAALDGDKNNKTKVYAMAIDANVIWLLIAILRRGIEECNMHNGLLS